MLDISLIIAQLIIRQTVACNCIAVFAVVAIVWCACRSSCVVFYSYLSETACSNDLWCRENILMSRATPTSSFDAATTSDTPNQLGFIVQSILEIDECNGCNECSQSNAYPFAVSSIPNPMAAKIVLQMTRDPAPMYKPDTPLSLITCRTQPGMSTGQVPVAIRVLMTSTGVTVQNKQREAK